jgi:hypothetical protein
MTSRQGRRGWLREAAQRLDQQRAREARPVARSREDRLLEAKRRLHEELAVERDANARYEAYRVGGRMKDGRRFGRPPDPFVSPTRRRGRSISAILIQSSFTGCAAGSRATTPKPPATSISSSSLPSS